MLNKKILRKAMAVLLVFAMFASMPFTVFADTPHPDAVTLANFINGGSHNWGIDNGGGLTATPTGNVVTVTGSHNVTYPGDLNMWVEIPEGITVEWNAQITINNQRGLQFRNGGGTLNINEAAEFTTITNSLVLTTEDPSAVVNINGGQMSGQNAHVISGEDFSGTLNINRGVLETQANHVAIHAPNATVNVRGGTITTPASTAINAGTLNHTGGLINGVRAAEIFDQIRVVIVPAATPTITGVTVDPDSLTIEPGGQQQFTAIVEGIDFPGDVVPQEVTWEIVYANGDPRTIDGVTLGANGLLEVAATVGAGTEFIVRATSDEDASEYDDASVVVSLRVAVVRIVSHTTPLELSPGATNIQITANAFAIVNGTETPISGATIYWSVHNLDGTPFTDPQDSGIILYIPTPGGNIAHLTIDATAALDTEFYIRATYVPAP